MAYSYIWPTTLPQVPQKGFSESIGANILRTPTDSGPAKLRRRGKSPSKLTVSFIMTTSEVAVLESFVETTIKATARFGFPHPRTKQTVETRMVPGQDGELFTVQYAAPEYWTVSLNLEILP